jgi:hypothetical protein
VKRLRRGREADFPAVLLLKRVRLKRPAKLRFLVVFQLFPKAD